MKKNIEVPTGSESKLSLEIVRDWNEWDSKIRESKQCSIFISSSYLGLTGLRDFARYIFFEEKLVGGLLLPELFVSTQGPAIRNYATYQSIWFIDESKLNSRANFRKNSIFNTIKT